MSLLQQHTKDIYGLESLEPFSFQVPARSLLVPQRFDLFAKLYYIIHRDIDRKLAERVYIEHIRAFNPDGREPGRDDKISINDFIVSFDNLIDQFKVEDFDDSVSVVPVDKNGVILDGAHRVAALAYYDKIVSIARYDSVEAKCDFDYIYFKNRGLSWSVCDVIALEMTRWLDNMRVACVWPLSSMSQQEEVVEHLRMKYPVGYVKQIRCNLKSLTRFVKYIYRSQDWTRNDSSVLDKALRVSGKSPLTLIFLGTDGNLEDLLAEKDAIRCLVKKNKDSLHITDTHDESVDVATITLTRDGLNMWFDSIAISRFNQLIDLFSESWLKFKKVRWIKFKAFIYNILH